MRLILDANILLSGLISERGAPAQLLDAWADDVFTLITSTEQIEELAARSRVGPW